MPTKHNPVMGVLELHGTTMGGLPPSSVMYTAEEDMRRKERNKNGEAYEQYAFHRRHVRKAKSPRMLLALAVAYREAGTGSHKKNTRLIYKDVETLKGAWMLAVDKYGAPTGAEEKLTTEVDNLPEEAHTQSIETEA